MRNDDALDHGTWSTAAVEPFDLAKLEAAVELIADMRPQRVPVRIVAGVDGFKALQAACAQYPPSVFPGIVLPRVGGLPVSVLFSVPLALVAVEYSDGSWERFA